MTKDEREPGTRLSARQAAKAALGEDAVAGVHFITTETKPGKWAWEPTELALPADPARNDYSAYDRRPGFQAPRGNKRPFARPDTRVHRGAFTTSQADDEPQADLFGSTTPAKGKPAAQGRPPGRKR